jgi:hypothetical protein
MTDAERESALRAEIARLKAEHTALSAELEGMGPAELGDRLLVQRLKKRKLALKDRIARLEDELYPDIIA